MKVLVITPLIFLPNRNDSFDFEVPPQTFTKLKKGGAANQHIIEAIVFQNGRKWSNQRLICLPSLNKISMIETPPTGVPLTPGLEYKKPRNVWKRQRKGGSREPMFYTILGLFTVPVEVLFRNNFGQRWLTLINFLAGLCVLALFAGIEWVLPVLFTSKYYFYLIGFVDGFTKGKILLPHFHPGLQLMRWLILTYVLRGFYHFFIIWWRNRAYRPMHSFDDGTSFFTPISIFLMRFINLLAAPFIFIFSFILPKSDRRRQKSMPPLLNNISAFTDIIVEPAFLLLLAYFIVWKTGVEGMASVWLLISAIAMIVHARRKTLIRLNKLLDFKDAGVDAGNWQSYHHFFQKRKTQAEERISKPAQNKSKKRIYAPEDFEIGSQLPDLNDMINDLHSSQ